MVMEARHLYNAGIPPANETWRSGGAVWKDGTTAFAFCDLGGTLRIIQPTFYCDAEML